MMIGGGGQPCTLGDHGIGITSVKDRSFIIRNLLRETTLVMLQRHHPKLVIR